MDSLRFDGRVAIITGAGRGLGKAYAELLAARGCKVVINDIGAAVGGGGYDGTLAITTAERIAKAGGSAVADSSDVTDPDQAAALVSSALARFGRLDIIINNAGIIRWRDFNETDAADLTAHFSVHVLGAFNVTRAAWPHMADRKYGRVLMTASSGMYGMPSTLAYGVAKAATLGLANSFAVAGKSDGILVNVISPGASTRMLPEEAGLSKAQRDALAPERVAPLAAWLVHERCSLTGQMFFSGAGRVARVFMAETPGYKNPDMNIEDLAAHWDQVEDMCGFFIPTSTADPRLRPE